MGDASDAGSTTGDGVLDLRSTSSRIGVDVRVLSTSEGLALDVSYDGTRPPLDLFATWEAQGWRPPTPATPPRDAIDWSTPDAARGTRHTIRPFLATGRAVRVAPPGDDRRHVVAAVDAARRRGHQVDTGDVDLDDVPGPGATRISAVLPVHVAPAVLAGAAARGARITASEATVHRTATRRGLRGTNEVPAVSVVIVVDDEAAIELLDVLGAHATTPPEVERGIG